jgi:hypothetical protein
MNFLFLFVLFSVHAAVYDCQTEFGETVPIDFELDSKLESFNSKVAMDTQLKTKVKERKLLGGTLRTRYAHSKGEDFSFELTCQKNPCQMNLLNRKGKRLIDEELIIPAPTIRDQRFSQAKGHVTFMITRRNPTGILARVYKKSGDQIITSASGEMKFYQETPKFSMDVGADEQLKLGKGSERIAGLEVKITCRRR